MKIFTKSVMQPFLWLLAIVCIFYAGYLYGRWQEIQYFYGQFLVERSMLVQKDLPPQVDRTLLIHMAQRINDYDTYRKSPALRGLLYLSAGDEVDEMKAEIQEMRVLTVRRLKSYGLDKLGNEIAKP